MALLAAGTAYRRHAQLRAVTDPAIDRAAGQTVAAVDMQVRDEAPGTVTTGGVMTRAGSIPATTSHREKREVEMKNAQSQVRGIATRTELQATIGVPPTPDKRVHGATTAAEAQRGAQPRPRHHGSASDTKAPEPTRRRDDDHKPREAVESSATAKEANEANEATKDRRRKDTEEKKLIKRHHTVYDESSEAYWKKHHEANRMDIKWLVWQADADISGFMADFAAQELANISQRIQSHEHQLAQWERGDDLPDLNNP
ncbi:hypothetical protein SPRG_00961 [Saprolegnia parasitica CBS 223.65]|uniref:Uncharacterized protein n=1 Tax=Saprolegnia parasitica (strain CBS 223.65) TaxID=695850 RepID=A0A067D7B2_SAPPC|nr:hypothetical protein SPRG_00961 [Saprolegnia parasitica CBS 223.65]KDO34902.1 hypothetical protein SPRG_00961 [Saprolegnia parasitica CBS 223.65]|eukprot:XP_012194561.1 hypothetical protein SPRG_00961 [Saprolegnia parasitica CBS 223.65]